MARQKVTPFLWFEKQAEEAASFYTSLLPNSAIKGKTSGPDGSVMVVEFTLAGIEFIALNGGPYFKLNEAFSISIDCADQTELDTLWEKLIADGGQPSQCGWLKDKFGLSWQLVPTVLPQMMADPNRTKSARVMAALMKMSKIDIETLVQAFES